MLLAKLFGLLALAVRIRADEPKRVFAHFVVGNANGNTIADWSDDIQKAQAAHIDGFALNVAAQDTSNRDSLDNAFAAANQIGNFKLFLSFDYAAQGPWSKWTVVEYMKNYGPKGAYFQYYGKPLVSTFEGPANSGDWNYIKSQTPIFFMPDYSSLGAQGAANTGVVDGLFSWNAWPNGASDMQPGDDQYYMSVLQGKPFMMPVSPWFFTNLPGWGKNWVWRGDDLWYDRWQQVLKLSPPLVEIITWNDYGESHYIGPLREKNFGLFKYASAPYNYAANMPHDAWRTFLPYVIDTYKSGKAPDISSEKAVAWFRTNPNNICHTGGTTGNTASQGQTEVDPASVSVDAVFYSALLNGPADVEVTIGDSTVRGSWRNTPAGGRGIYHGSVPFNFATGPVTVRVFHGSNTVATVTGGSITRNCENLIENFNAWTGASA